VYPSSPTTYKLPFDGKIRVSSRRRYILVRWLPGAEAKPFIVLRSDKTLKLEDRNTDYVIDQTTGRVLFYFNDRAEVFEPKSGLTRRALPEEVK
jgi:hypothetical protein